MAKATEIIKYLVLPIKAFENIGYKIVLIRSCKVVLAGYVRIKNTKTLGSVQIIRLIPQPILDFENLCSLYCCNLLFRFDRPLESAKRRKIFSSLLHFLLLLGLPGLSASWCWYLRMRLTWWLWAGFSQGLTHCRQVFSLFFVLVES